MRKYKGFTLIELVMFIIIVSIVAGGVVLSLMNTLQNTPLITQNTIAIQTANQCVEWFMGQRYLNGYQSITCNSITPSFCTTPSGYQITVSCSNTTINGDNNYKTINIHVTGEAEVLLNLMIANY